MTLSRLSRTSKDCSARACPAARSSTAASPWTTAPSRTTPLSTWEMRRWHILTGRGFKSAGMMLLFSATMLERAEEYIGMSITVPALTGAFSMQPRTPSFCTAASSRPLIKFCRPRSATLSASSAFGSHQIPLRSGGALFRLFRRTAAGFRSASLPESLRTSCLRKPRLVSGKQGEASLPGRRSLVVASRRQQTPGVRGSEALGP
jgi:hypothetical protein